MCMHDTVGSTVWCMCACVVWCVCVCAFICIMCVCVSDLCVCDVCAGDKSLKYIIAELQLIVSKSVNVEL